MTDVPAMLSRLEREGTTFVLEGDAIRLRGGAQKIDPLMLRILKSNRDEVLHLLKKRAEMKQGPNFKVRDRSNPSPVSRNQLAQYLESVSRGGPADHYAAEYLINGEVDLELLQQSYGRIVQRHEILRTRYRRTEDGSVWQVVEPAPKIDVDYDDVSILPREAALERARAMAAAWRTEDIDLCRNLPLRSKIVRLSQDEFMFIVIAHRVAMDTISWSIFLEELRGNYSSLLTGAPAHAGALEHQYADYAIWENEAQTEQRPEHTFGNWGVRLQDVGPLTLPRKQVAGSPSGVADPSVRISFRSIENLRAFCQIQDITPAVIVTGALCALLGRLCGQSKIVIGSANGGRPPAMRDLIGPFARTSPYHLDVSGDPTFTEFVKAARSAQLRATDLRRPISLELSERLKLNGIVVNYAAVHAVLSAQARLPLVRGNEQGPSLSILESTQPYWMYFARECYVGFTETPDELSGMISYDSDVLAREIVEGLARDLPAFLEAGLRKPTDRLSQIVLER